MRQKVAEIDEQLELRVRPGDAMAGLPIEVQQLLAFGKAIYLEDAKVVLLDEITASLSGAAGPHSCAGSASSRRAARSP